MRISDWSSYVCSSDLSAAGNGESDRRSRRSELARDHQLLDLGDRLGRIEAFGAGLRAVHDGVAAVEPEGILELVEPLAGRLVTAVGDPAVGAQQDGGAEVAVAVPPVARAGGRAAKAHDALPQAVELRALLRALQALALRRRRLRLQPGLDQGVLRIDLRQVRHTF